MNGVVMYGFDVDSLLKIKDVKTSDKKSDLLRVIMKIVAEKHTDLLNVGEELINCCLATTFDKDFVNTELKRIRDGLGLVKQQLLLKDKRVESDKYHEIMENFYSESESICNILEEKLTNLDKEIENVCILFGEPKEDVLKKPSTFFAKIKQFVADINEAHQKNNKEVEEEEKKKKLLEKQQEKLRLEEEKKKKKLEGGNNIPNDEDDSDKISNKKNSKLDNLKSGSFFLSEMKDRQLKKFGKN
jgi:hypothetical protein